MEIDKTRIQNAAYDLRFLLNRGYRKKGALRFVANKYLLNKQERNFLARSVFSNLKSKERKEKIINMEKIGNKNLFVDGYNVLITVESICAGDDLVIMCDDGIVRDLNAVFGKYKFSEMTEKALSQIISSIKRYKPLSVNFFYDSPVSFSGKLAKLTKKVIDDYEVEGSVNLSKNVDFELVKVTKQKNGIVATSDSIIIDKVEKVVDIPFYLLKNRIEINK